MGMLECCCYVIRQPMTLLLSYGLFTVNLFMLSVNAFIAQCVLLCVLLGRDTGRRLLALIDSNDINGLRQDEALYLLPSDLNAHRQQKWLKSTYMVMAWTHDRDERNEDRRQISFLPRGTFVSICTYSKSVEVIEFL